MTISGPRIPGRDTDDPLLTDPAPPPPPPSGTFIPPNPPQALLDEVGDDLGRLVWTGSKWIVTPDETAPTDVAPSEVTSGGGGGGGTTGGDTDTSIDTGTDTGTDSDSDAATAAQLNLQGATLVRVGTGTNRRYYVEWLVYGVPIRHVIGDQTDFDNLGAQDWPSIITISEAEFGNRAGIDAGLVDERFGITETYQRSVDEQLRIFGQEDLPEWQRNSEVMTILMTAANEGFSPGRTLGLVAETDAFKQEHPFFDQVRGLLQGQSLQQAYQYYVNSRDQIRESIRAYRGVSGDDFAIAEVMAKGWDPEEVEDVLIGEAALRAMPGAADQINAILEFQGSDQRVTNENLIDLIRKQATERTPLEFQELINDALRAQALQLQGIDISPALAEALGTGESFETLDPTTLSKVAQETATNIFRFGEELRAEREGLSRDDLIKAAFDGDFSADVGRLLAKFARRRQQEAQGFAGVSSFQDEAGQLRVFGLSNI